MQSTQDIGPMTRMHSRPGEGRHGGCWGGLGSDILTVTDATGDGVEGVIADETSRGDSAAVGLCGVFLRGRGASAGLTQVWLDLASADDSLLLLKPLEQSAGGYFHRGADLYGQGNVFASRADSDFVLLSAWAHGATEDPRCIEPGSDQ